METIDRERIPTKEKESGVKRLVGRVFLIGSLLGGGYVAEQTRVNAWRADATDATSISHETTGATKDSAKEVTRRVIENTDKSQIDGRYDAVSKDGSERGTFVLRKAMVDGHVVNCIVEGGEEEIVGSIVIAHREGEDPKVFQDRKDALKAEFLHLADTKAEPRHVFAEVVASADSGLVNVFNGSHERLEVGWLEAGNMVGQFYENDHPVGKAVQIQARELGNEDAAKLIETVRRGHTGDM